jgi:hypothetical protein
LGNRIFYADRELKITEATGNRLNLAQAQAQIVDSLLLPGK